MNEVPAKIIREGVMHEGKAKIIYLTSATDMLIQYFKDDATAFNGKKKGTIPNKGACNNDISSHIFPLMEKEGIRTHFIDKLSEREMLVKRVEIIPVEVVVRNVVAGSLAKRMGRETGEILPEPIIEYYYKDDALGDPMINRSHIKIFHLAKDDEMDHIQKEAFKINDWLKAFFDKIGITLVDYKLEFGRSGDEILLADEISPDGCRLWDKKTGDILDKDRFRRDLGKLTETYEEVRRRALSVS